MSDWLDDLYESPGSDEISLLHRKDEIVGCIISEFDVGGKSKVRLRWVVEEKMKIEGHFYSSDLLEIYYAIIQTGDYNGTLFKYEGISDALVWRKPWHERHRYLEIAIITAVSIIVGYVIGLISNR